MQSTAMHLSNDGLQFIKRWQGLSLEPYQDEAGMWVIGYGHIINGADDFDIAITPEIADAQLRLDIWRCEAMLRRCLRVTLSPPRFDALVSLTLSSWPTGSGLHPLLAFINQENVAIALQFWRQQTSLHGHTSLFLHRLRQAECRLFNSGCYPTPAIDEIAARPGCDFSPPDADTALPGVLLPSPR